MKKAPDKERWDEVAQNELRDTPLENLKRDYGGLEVEPVYLGEDGSIPGAEPFTRGVRATMYACLLYTSPSPRDS